MKVSYQWLQTFFDSPLPPPNELAELLTFHSSEIEEVVKVGADTVLDIKVLPDKSAWLMSHRGVAKEISVITGVPLSVDPLTARTSLDAETDRLEVRLATKACDHYSAALIEGVAVGESPAWLKERLASLGQRSINNLVDATNYVMFMVGQPLHAFDADKLAVDSDGVKRLLVRPARSEETITTLTGEAYILSDQDAVIADGNDDAALAIAGVKGGQQAMVGQETRNIVLESAHFDRYSVYKTSKRIKLRTDASARYENGLTTALSPIGLSLAVSVIIDVAGGRLVGVRSVGPSQVVREPVACPLLKLRSMLGVDLAVEDIRHIMDNFGYQYDISDDVLTVTPPMERDDIQVSEDVIEEVGRIHGLESIVSIKPDPGPVNELNARHYYAEKIRNSLTQLGFSEIYTSSFRDQDEVKLASSLASDKEYLRSDLHKNLSEAVKKNVPHRDLLGLSAIKLFEIGTVFSKDKESFNVALAVQTGTEYKAKIDDPLLNEGLEAIRSVLGLSIDPVRISSGVAEFSLDQLVEKLPAPTQYEPVVKSDPVVYQPFSPYPSVSRDVAMWVPAATAVSTVADIIRNIAGPLCVRLTHLDTYEKDGRTSLAFRLVFQSKEKTLDSSVVDPVMTGIYDAAAGQGWEIR